MLKKEVQTVVKDSNQYEDSVCSRVESVVLCIKLCII